MKNTVKFENVLKCSHH